jgi:hypothetical protein
MKAALQQALDAMVGADQIDTDMRDAIYACREALEEPDQPPVAWVGGNTGTSFTQVLERANKWKRKGLECVPLYLGDKT